jgi:hypothetical protein
VNASSARSSTTLDVDHPQFVLYRLEGGDRRAQN